MRQRLTPIALMAVLMSVAVAAGPVLAANGDKVNFAAGISDLPLMAGLTQKTDRGYVFDKPDGRIVEVVADGPADLGAARDFYIAVLPEFGWRRAAGPVAEAPDRQPGNRLYFERDGERLRLAITRRRAVMTLRFTLTPKP